MKRYSIFIKSPKFFHWSNDKIVLAIMLGSGIIIFIKSKVLGLPKNEFDKYPLLAIVGTFFLGILLKLFRITKPDPLRGKLEGFLSFEPDRIVAGEIIFNMKEVKHIRITNDDYYGKVTGTGKTFNSSLSNGVDNICKITLLDGRIYRYNYEMYYPYDLQKSRNELINYYRLGKLDFNNLVDLLGITGKEIPEFKDSIEKINSGSSFEAVD